MILQSVDAFRSTFQFFLQNELAESGTQVSHLVSCHPYGTGLISQKASMGEYQPTITQDGFTHRGSPSRQSTHLNSH